MAFQRHHVLHDLHGRLLQPEFCILVQLLRIFRGQQGMHLVVNAEIGGEILNIGLQDKNTFRQSIDTAPVIFQSALQVFIIVIKKKYGAYENQHRRDNQIPIKNQFHFYT